MLVVLRASLSAGCVLLGMVAGVEVECRSMRRS